MALTKVIGDGVGSISGVNLSSGNVTVIDGQGFYFGDGSYRIEGKDDGATTARIGFVAGGSEVARFTSSGLTFGGDTAAANALDDYEEGSFTPALTVGTITSPDGRYVKIGKQVTVWIYAPTISDTSTASTLEITGLPYTSESTSLMDSTAGTVMLRYLDDGVAEPLTITSWMNSNDTKVRFYVNTGNGNSYSVVQYAHFGSNNVGIRVTHTYMSS
jgi:hypothetical protein